MVDPATELQSIDAEKAVLGSILLNRDALIPVSVMLTPDSFFLRRHALIFQAMMACYERRIPPDTHTVANALRASDHLEACGGVLYLTELAAFVPTSYHVEHYAAIVAELAVRRRIAAIGAQTVALAHDRSQPVERIAEQTVRSLTQAAGRGTAASDITPITTVIDHWYTQMASDRTERGISSGYRAIDAYTDGLHNGDLIVIAARPGMGKTSIALCIARNAAIQGFASLIVSLEMSSVQILHRLAAIETGSVDVRAIRAGTVTDTEMSALLTAFGRMAQWPMAFIDRTVQIADIALLARTLQCEGRIDLLVVDYLQLVATGTHDNRVQEVSAVSRGLKQIARELDIPVIALSQVSRAVETRSSRTPALSDLRDSGAIEQDADVVMFLSRAEESEEAAIPDPSRPLKVTVTIAKQRHGPTGVVTLGFLPKTTQFIDWDPAADALGASVPAAHHPLRGGRSSHGAGRHPQSTE
ncbi:replicative DNA helicase [Roseiflexus castenholzii]|uniref:replicative DNA helicase n=1 Tax=Roseiflexus castenholzii TaxID=120962 RepID=UPI003C7C16AE